MKKSLAVLNTPARLVLAVALLMLMGEFLIMVLIEGAHKALPKDALLKVVAFEFIDPILLILLVSPALFLLIFKPMRAQQVQMERQLDELRRFQNLSIGRELRMKELLEEITALRNPLSVEPADDIAVTSGSHQALRQVTTRLPEEGRRSAMLFMLEDLEAERHRVDRAHQEWMEALDVLEDPFFLHDQQFRILRCNKAYQQRAGIPFKQIIGRPYYEIFPKTGAPLPGCLRTMEKAEEEIEAEVVIGKTSYRSRAFSIRDGQQAYLYSVHTLTDITGRKRAEAATAHANRALATLSAVNRTLVHAGTEGDLLQSICQAIVQQRGYQLAWVGYVQHNESKSIKIMAHGSNDGGYPDTMQPTWAETEQGMGPSGRAVRSGATQLCQDIANDPHYLPWHDEAIKCGYLSSIALPLLNGDSTVFGTLTVYSNEVNAFSPAEISLLEEMAADLAFGVRVLHTRHERDLALEKNQQQLLQLKDSLEGTVRAIALMVEMRDPYTAGHQVRVADLAAAIARQMRLPDEEVHAVHLASTVHDLGKIRVPAEILSKPGKISATEFALIKVHAQEGYDILKDINFPWPIAPMVLQHHERMDGSGYPQGLKGDQIILEARIIAVADVVEAMSSHRPYRPGLGLEAALVEVTKMRGSHFDPKVVDACLSLFREQAYSFRG